MASAGKEGGSQQRTYYFNRNTRAHVQNINDYVKHPVCLTGHHKWKWLPTSENFYFIFLNANRREK